jgi:sensor histidine kinase regulating citrate/malate metabolism
MIEMPLWSVLAKSSDGVLTKRMNKSKQIAQVANNFRSESVAGGTSRHFKPTTYCLARHLERMPTVRHAKTASHMVTFVGNIWTNALATTAPKNRRLTIFTTNVVKTTMAAATHSTFKK